MVRYYNEKQEIEHQKMDKLEKLKRMNEIRDTRVHLLLYFFTGHHTNVGDFLMLKKLQSYVNIIPCISKADSFKEQELHNMKVDISGTAADRHVKFFDCREAINSVTGSVRMKILTRIGQSSKQQDLQ